MFENLTGRLSEAARNLSAARAGITENNIKDTLAGKCVWRLLEADVALPVVKILY